MLVSEPDLHMQESGSETMIMCTLYFNKLEMTSLIPSAIKVFLYTPLTVLM